MRFRNLPAELQCYDLEFSKVRGQFYDGLHFCFLCGYHDGQQGLFTVCCDRHICVPCSEQMKISEISEEYCSRCKKLFCKGPQASRFDGFPILTRVVFQCPCGSQGTLKELRIHHQNSCVHERDHLRLALTKNAPSITEESIQKIILEELSRIKEDLLNSLSSRIPSATLLPSSKLQGTLEERFESLYSNCSRAIERISVLEEKFTRFPSTQGNDLQNAESSVRNED